MKRAVVFLAEGFEEVEAVTPIDFLRRAGIEVITAGVGGASIQGAHGIRIQTEKNIEDLSMDNFDGIVIPGGMPGAANLAAAPKVSQLLRDASEAGKMIAAICASPAVVLSPAGLLKGKSATCYPGFEKDLVCGSFVEERVVIDGSIITSRGPGTAAEFAVKIIEYLAGADAAKEVFTATLQK